MKIEVKKEKDHTLYIAYTNINCNDYDEIDALRSIDDSRVVIDFSQIHSIGSCVIGSIIELRQKVSDIRIIANSNIYKILKCLGIVGYIKCLEVTYDNR